jgi:SAM-dependent methyltransferase
LLDFCPIEEMSYPDFVGYINQWNVLPGSYSTLSEWATFSRLGPQSRLLQLGCTTGFQARELAVLTGCTAHGIDVSQRAVDAARYNARIYAPESRITYDCIDALDFSSDTRFTHIALGAGLRFFANPKKVIERLPSLMEDGGYILASPFYVNSPVPQHILERGREVFGVLPTTAGYDEVLADFTDFEVLYESRKDLLPEPESQLADYCRATIERAALMHEISDPEWQRQARERLLDVRRMSNDLRPYQGYSVLVLRYRASTYPNRYVELF